MIALILTDIVTNQQIYGIRLGDSGSLRRAEYGDDTLDVALRVARYVAMDIYRRDSLLDLRVMLGGSTIWRGRVEEKRLTTDGINLTAYGYWRAFSDLLHTALWSTTALDGWRPIEKTDFTAFNATRFDFRTQNALVITSQKNTTYNTGDAIAGFFTEVPDTSPSDRLFTAIQFDLVFVAPLDWRFRLIAYNSFGNPLTHFDRTSTGAIITTSVCVAVVGREQLVFALNVPPGTTETAETGDHYAQITNIRVATDATNFFATTVAVGIAAGTRTVTPASMVGIVVGQRLTIDHANNSVGESVIVTAITDTTFTADFANAHGNGFTVRGFAVYPPDIMQYLLTTIDAGNPGQISTDTARIAAHQRDLLDAAYADTPFVDVLRDLTTRGNNENEIYRIGVGSDQRLQFQSLGSGQTYYADIDELDVATVLDSLVNAAYAVYEDTNGRIRRTAAQDSTTSQVRYGLLRQSVVTSRTTSATDATDQAQTELEARQDITPQATIRIRQLLTESGGIVPSWEVQPWDEIIIRNLPIDLGPTARDRIKRFYVREVEIDLVTSAPNLVPETNPARLDVLIAQR